MTAQSRKHVLIIEDEMMIAIEIESMLIDLGYETFDFAKSPGEAIALATLHPPNLICSDYNILNGTGVEAVKGIVAAIGPVPTIFITGNADLVARETTAPIVEKPIAPAALARACRLIGAA